MEKWARRAYTRRVIDTHVHAFPALAHYSGQLGLDLGPVASLFGAASAVARRVGLDRLGPGDDALLDIEKVAALRTRASPWFSRSLEAVLTTVASPSVLVSGTLNKLLESMDRHGIERSVAIAGPPVATNDWLLGPALELAGERIIPVPTFPEVPPEGTERAWREGFEDLAERGARGFKIHPNLEGIDASHPGCRALFEVASARDLFVILHTGCFEIVGYKRKSPVEPAEFRQLFEAFSDVRVCLAHMNRDHPERAWEMMLEFDQLYADTSWQPAARIREAVDRIGVDRILLGSDWPLLHSDLQGDAVALLREAVTPEAVARITGHNAAAFIG